MSHYITISFLKISTPLHRLTCENTQFEEKSFKIIHFLFRHGQQRWLFEFCSQNRVKHSQPTNGTVLSVPSLATFTLPVFTGAMFRAAGMAGSLVAGCARPAFLAATRATHAHTMCAAVHRTDFWIWEERGGEKEAESAHGRERVCINKQRYILIQHVKNKKGKILEN